MKVTVLYSITVGGLLGLILLHRAILFTKKAVHSDTVRVARAWMSRYLEPALINRRRYFPRVSRANAALQLAYWAGTAVCNLVGVSSVPEASQRAAALTSINMMPLLLGDRLAFAADALMLPHQAYQQIHKAIGVMTMIQMAAHITLEHIARRLDVRVFRDCLALVVSYFDEIGEPS